MADPYAPEGVLPNALRWLDRPGQAERNLFAGRPAAAGRQLLDFIGEGIDALIPGDWIPAATDRFDYVSSSELLGMNEPGVGKTAVDIVGDTLTNPLSFLTFAKAPTGGTSIRAGLPFTEGTEIAQTARRVDPLSLGMDATDYALSKGAQGLDRLGQSGTVAGAQRAPVSQGYENLKAWIRRAAGAEDIDPALRARLSEAAAEGSTAARLWSGKASEAMQGLSNDERVLLSKAFYGIDLGSLTPGAKPQATALGSDVLANVATLAGKYGKDATKLQDAARRMLDISRGQWDEGVAKGVFTPGQGADNYLRREWLFPANEEGVYSGIAKSARERQLTTPQDIANFINQGDVGLELDAGRLMMNRASEQGRMLSQARAASDVLGAPTGGGIKQMQEQALAAVEQMALKPDEKRMLVQAISGMEPRGGFFRALAGLSRPIKGSMVYGVVLPKFGSLVRNKLGMGFQALATPGAEGQALQQLNPYNVFKEMGKAWDEAYGTALFGKADDMSKSMQAIEDAFKQAKNTDEVQAILRRQKLDMEADAVKHGVLDGFVASEELVKAMARSPGMQKWMDIYNAPAVMFQTLEQRGRLQMFKNLRDQMKDGASAAAKTKEALYDYGVSSPENRAFRDVIPFGQFVAKAIPQQAQWVSRMPAVGVAASPLFYDPSGDQPPTLPWMSGKSRLQLGNDEAGNAAFLTGFGLPLEALDSIPNLSASPREAGRDVSQSVLGSTQPVLKTLGAFATGRDPYFGTPFASYDKLPIVGEAGDLGRAVNVLSGTGWLEPLGYGIARQAGNLTDSEKSLGARAADFATGAKLVSVDPDVAEQQVITRYLESRPDVQQYRTFYQTEKDAEFDALMQALREAKARVKEKREAQPGI